MYKVHQGYRKNKNKKHHLRLIHAYLQNQAKSSWFLLKNSLPKEAKTLKKSLIDKKVLSEL